MKNLVRHLAIITILAVSLPGRASAQVTVDRPVLTLEGVKVIAAAAEAEAVANGWNVVIVITDAAGNLRYLLRMDGASLGTVEVAQQKARTSAVYGRPTKVFADWLASGNSLATVLPGVIPLQGGLPIIVGNQVIGAVGVSGVTSEQDAQIGQAGITALLARMKR